MTSGRRNVLIWGEITLSMQIKVFSVIVNSNAAALNTRHALRYVYTQTTLLLVLDIAPPRPSPSSLLLS